MPTTDVLEALAKEPVRALLIALRYGPLDYDSVASIASGGTSDAALKHLVRLHAIRVERLARRSSYELTTYGRDMLAAVDFAGGLPGGVAIFHILYCSGGRQVLVQHMGYLVRDLHRFPDSTRATVTRRLRDAGAITQARPPQVIDAEGHRVLLVMLHLLARRRHEELAAQAWEDASALRFEPPPP